MSVIYRALRKLQQENLKKDLPGTPCNPDGVSGVGAFMRAAREKKAFLAAATIAVVAVSGTVILLMSGGPNRPIRQNVQIDGGEPERATAAVSIPEDAVADGADVPAPGEDAFERFLLTAVLPSLPGNTGQRPVEPGRELPSLDALAAGLGATSEGGVLAEAAGDVPPDPAPPRGERAAADASSGTTVAKATEAPQGGGERGPVVAVTRVVKVGQLARQVRAAITKGDGDKVGRGLSELSRLKGSTDPFVMKLRAYWHIKKGEYEPAENLLYRVLKERSVDMEAALNLAVIEARTGRLHRARTRTQSLLNLYPDEPRVRRLAEELKQ